MGQNLLPAISKAVDVPIGRFGVGLMSLMKIGRGMKRFRKSSRKW